MNCQKILSEIQNLLNKESLTREEYNQLGELVTWICDKSDVQWSQDTATVISKVINRLREYINECPDINYIINVNKSIISGICRQSAHLSE